MRHPLEFLPDNLRKPFFYIFFTLTLIIFGVFSQLDRPLQNASTPCGIVSFELAMTPERSSAIILSWEEPRYLDFPEYLDTYYPPKLYAAFGLGLDYLFMPVYALALSLGILLTLDNKPTQYYFFASLMGWGAFIAALFDSVENYALWHILTVGAVSPYPQISALCATLKFILLILGLITIAIGKLMFLTKKKPA